MKFVLPYKLFEANFRDSITNVKNPDIEEYIRNNQLNDVELVTSITLDEEYNEEEVKFVITYNHSINHDLIERFYKRAGINTISEFNDTLRHGFNEIYPENLNTANLSFDRHPQKWSIYFEKDTGTGFSIIYNIKMKNDNDPIYNVFVFTIVPNRAHRRDKEFTVEI